MMDRILNLPTRRKLLLAIVPLLAVLGIVVAMGYSVLNGTRAAYAQLLANAVEGEILSAEVRSHVNRMRVQMLEMQLALDDDASALHAAETDLNAKSAQILSKLTALRERVMGDAQLTARLAEMEAVLGDYLADGRRQFGLLGAGRQAEARAMGEGVQSERYDAIRDAALVLADEMSQRVEHVQGEIAERVEDAVQTFVALSVAALLFGVAVIAFLNRAIAVPLTEIATRAQRIAAGETSVVAAARMRSDEIGQLEAKFNEMAVSLDDKARAAVRIADGDLRIEVSVASDRDVLGTAFAEMVQRLREMSRDLTEGVDVLAASSSEILSGTSQIAAGAAQTASAMAETATTVEEVKQTAQLSAQKARAVSEGAQRAASVSQDGLKAANDAVQGMQDIREQMERIAESIVRLSEQSQAVGEIILTVNDLAEQSNLLAVNASIEAARAGEHGKGFGAVAQEVKSLAEQSKQATSQVRSILGDIQKATTEAVLATEQGSKAVEVGGRLAQRAGQAIDQLAGSIGESAQAATQIAVSAQQQLAGMDQVALAAENIKVATAQSLDSTRQTETTAHNLHALGKKLQTIVGRYRL